LRSALVALRDRQAAAWLALNRPHRMEDVTAALDRLIGDLG